MRIDVLVLSVFLLFHIHSAAAKEQVPAGAPACGSTVSEALLQAKNASAVADPASQRVALVCLTEAVIVMNGKIRELDDAAQRPNVLRAPITSLPVQPRSQ